jgi:hypothetical protein
LTLFFSGIHTALRDTDKVNHFETLGAYPLISLIANFFSTKNVILSGSNVPIRMNKEIFYPFSSVGMKQRDPSWIFHGRDTIGGSDVLIPKSVPVIFRNLVFTQRFNNAIREL